MPYWENSGRGPALRQPPTACASAVGSAQARRRRRRRAPEDGIERPRPRADQQQKRGAQQLRILRADLVQDGPKTGLRAPRAAAPMDTCRDRAGSSSSVWRRPSRSSVGTAITRVRRPAISKRPPTISSAADEARHHVRKRDPELGEAADPLGRREHELHDALPEKDAAHHQADQDRRPRGAYLAGPGTSE